MSGDAALIWCPFPDETAARAAISLLLDARMIACANIIPHIRSLFVWEGTREESEECGALIKTTAERMDEAMACLRTRHPYASPAITAWRVSATAETIAWLRAETDANAR